MSLPIEPIPAVTQRYYGNGVLVTEASIGGARLSLRARLLASSALSTKGEDR